MKLVARNAQKKKLCWPTYCGRILLSEINENKYRLAKEKRCLQRLKGKLATAALNTYENNEECVSFSGKIVYVNSVISFICRMGDLSANLPRFRADYSKQEWNEYKELFLMYLGTQVFLQESAKLARLKLIGGVEMLRLLTSRTIFRRK